MSRLVASADKPSTSQGLCVSEPLSVPSTLSQPVASEGPGLELQPHQLSVAVAEDAALPPEAP